MTINTGSRDELPAEYGMAHFAEHTLFKGTTRRKAWQVNCRLENVGGELNAFTTKEETVIHATTLKGDFRKAAELISDILFNSTFPEHEIAKEKLVIFDEINLYKDSPAERIYDDFEDMIFAGSDLGHNILGTKASLRKMSGSNIKSFINRTYNTDQMVFSAIGNIPEKTFDLIMESYFGHIPANHRSFSRIMTATPDPFNKQVGKNTHQTHCIMGKRAYSLGEQNRIPLLLLVNALGGPSANSMLNVLLREKNALSYGIEASYTPFTDTGISTIYFSCEKENSERCLDLINRQLKELRENIISPRRLSIAKKQFLGQVAITSENNEGYMLSAGKSYLVFGDVDSIESAAQKINGITGSQIMEVANDVFNDMSMLMYK